jgi:hypothetical protein
MEYFSQKDDMTRIGGLINNTPLEDEKSRKDSFQPVTPAPGPSWQSPPHENPSRSSSSPLSDPYSPPPPTPDRYHLSPQQDDMWFLVDIAGNLVEYPLRHGESITLGRDSNQDIVIKDKTLSRKHLVMQRNGDRITVQVLGLNGLVYANQIYKSTSLEVVVPCSLTIGTVVCQIKKKIDTDATILMNDPAAAVRQRPGAGFSANDGASRQPSFSPPPSPAPSWPPNDNLPFGNPPPEEKFPFAADRPIPPVFPAGQSAEKFPGSSPYSPPSFDFPHNGSTDSRREGMAQDVPAINGGGGKSKTGKWGLIIGGVGLVVLIVAISLFFWLRNPFAPKEEGGKNVEQFIPAKAQEPIPSRQDIPQPQTNNLYGQYLMKAKNYFTEGKYMDACDYLKDIPPTSPYRSEAVELAKQIPDCKL